MIMIKEVQALRVGLAELPSRGAETTVEIEDAVACIRVLGKEGGCVGYFVDAAEAAEGYLGQSAGVEI
jgi:hypothetical protein